MGETGIEQFWPNFALQVDDVAVTDRRVVDNILTVRIPSLLLQ